MQARTRRPWPTCSCTRPTTRCVAALHAYAHALAAPRDRKFHRLPSPCTISVFQALAEALTTSKAMVGRRLLQCSQLSRVVDIGFTSITVGFASECTTLVNAFKATWDKAKKAAVDGVTTLLNEAKAATRAVEKLANDAAAAATKKFNEFKARAEKLALEAAAAATKKFNEFKARAERLAREATKTLNAVKADLEKAANEATQFIDDVGNAFGELGNEIQCAHPSRLLPLASRLLPAFRLPPSTRLSLPALL